MNPRGNYGNINLPLLEKSNTPLKFHVLQMSQVGYLKFYTPYGY